MIDNNSIKIDGLKGEFYIEYVENDRVRRIYFPYSALETLRSRIDEFTTANASLLASLPAVDDNDE